MRSRGARFALAASTLVLATTVLATCSTQQPHVDAGDSPVDAGEMPDAGDATPIVADCDDGWCRIPPGTFIMGSPADEWGHPARSENQV